MGNQIVLPKKEDGDVVDGVIVNQLHLKMMYYILKALDIILIVAFFAVSRALLYENISPMFGLAVLLVRLLWHKLDTRIRKDLGIENTTDKKRR